MPGEEHAAGVRPERVQYVDGGISIVQHKGVEGKGTMNGRAVKDHARHTITAVGSLVQQLRRDSGVSIANLAARSELSPGLLSQMERGQGNPSFTTLIKLAQALDVPVGRFFGGEDEGGAVVRHRERRRLLVAEENLVYELLTPHMRGHLGMVQAQIAAGWSNEDAPFRHPGEECVTIISGRLYVCVNGTGHDLGEGDSMTYDSSWPHWYRNPTDRRAVLIGAMTPPSF